MTTLPLPPEIKSVEEHARVLANGNEVDWCNSWMALIRELESLTKQRDIAIWNAAIDKAAETIMPNVINSDRQAAKELCVRALLNLKRKE